MDTTNKFGIIRPKGSITKANNIIKLPKITNGFLPIMSINAPEINVNGDEITLSKVYNEPSKKTPPFSYTIILRI